MWTPSFSKDYATSTTEKVSTRITMEPKLDPNLSWWDLQVGKFLSYRAFEWWKVKTLVHALSAMNAPVDLVCVRCPPHARERAGYSPKHHRVWICANHIWNPFEFRRLLAHELVHAFDFARARIDVANLEHVACTEVRAWNLSGECELFTKWFQYLGDDMIDRRQKCVRDGALALKAGILSPKPML